MADRMTFLFDFFVVNARIRSLLGQAVAGSALRPDEYAVYSAVVRDGPVTITALARTLGMPLATTSDYLRTMTSRGHVRRYRNPDDNRSYLVVATDAGTAAHRSAQEVFHSVLARVRDALPIPEPDLVRALDALGEAVRAAQESLPDLDPGARRARPPLSG